MRKFSQTVNELLSVAGILLLGFAPSALAQEAKPASAPVDYNRQVRPILANHCYKCHGPDAAERKAELRFDVRASAIGKGESGELAIVPGDPKASELIKRINATDDDVRMPPKETNKTLSASEKEILTRWIAEGARFETHWAFIAPQRPAVPQVKRGVWSRGEIDRFILARLEAAGLAPSPDADRATLIRRLTLDLTGLPPTLEEVDAFLADKSPDAYERLVDRLMASPNYGERMAVDWLDASRFADTHGYHIDSGRDMTRWREYVIDSFNRNLPYDQFTVEQLAGDLLPDGPDPQQNLRQKLASGFNRNHMINFEGGAIAQEYLTAYIVDRVNTTGTVFLGLTVACTQCHDHKFDPITQREFYQLYAFFNNVPEKGLDGSKGNAEPTIKAPTAGQRAQLAQLTADIKRVEERLASTTPELPATEKEALNAELTALKAKQAELDKLVPTAMVMQEQPAMRETFVLARGAYDKPSDKVTAGTPSFLPQLSDDLPRNRLGLARWLVDPQHPLTARVTVNRYWQLFFGTGLVKTAEDFGTQGELPSHGDLLDWLAVDFLTPARSASEGSSWNVKRLVRQIVTSSTYRQSSRSSPELNARDPENRLLARGPRFRLQAEFIRDQALHAAGLLDPKIGGKSVSPYQPAGIWEELASRADGDKWTAQKYTQDHGQDLYRRTMYTYWKRTAPPPSLMTFDAPDRETCTVRRSRTNTPLQALVLMNDPTYVEAARKFAERIMREGGGSLDDRLTFAFRTILSRAPTEGELPVLRGVYERQLAIFQHSSDAAGKLLAIGEAPRDESLAAAELAAWTVVASAILNTDEAVTKG